MAYYNESDPFAAEWLRRLASAGKITSGVVDGRSIAKVRPDHVTSHRAHFFAGIGGWDLALQLAGWPDDAPVWTGSCPCQPFSAAGKKAGFADDRHLWPTWFRLIRECRPPVIFGEQVAGSAGLDWLDLVCLDLEGEGYAVGAADLAAASVGAPHKRQRLYWVAYNVWLTPTGRLGDTGVDRAREHTRELPRNEGEHDQRGTHSDHSPELAGSVGHWSNAEWAQCSDGRSRPFEPGSFPLAHGVPNRVGKLRGFGNAIVPPLAAEFIRSAMTAIGIR